MEPLQTVEPVDPKAALSTATADFAKVDGDLATMRKERDVLAQQLEKKNEEIEKKEKLHADKRAALQKALAGG